MRRVFFLAAAALLLAGCNGAPYSYPPPSEAPLAPPQPNTRPQPPRVASQPLPNPHSVKPLNMGVLTAKNVGNYMDDEEKQLRAQLHGSGVGVGRPGDAVTLYLRDDMIFKADTLTFSPAGTRILTYIAASAVRFDSTAITVNGYADTSVAPDRALQDTQQRANAVAQVLTAAGVNVHRIDVHGLGATHLKIPTGPNASEPRNRRIEILIKPKMTA